ncbi:MAG: hypothetical protein Tsb0019_20120 [Roseibium sp.]
MPSVDNPNIRRTGSARSDLHEARPLLQAILIGIVLATVLVAAAAFAAPDGSASARSAPVPTASEPAPRP